MGLVSELAPAADADAAAWVVRGLRGFAESVLSVVPSGFPAYVRVFHAAGGEAGALAWAEIARSFGGRFHAGMQLHVVTGRHAWRNEAPPPPLTRWPEEGSLPRELAPRLATVLRRHTSTPARCSFAFWTGFAAIHGLDLMRRSPTFEAAAREYFLLAGPIDAVATKVTADNVYFQSANLWWPDDRTWCVATEIDLNTTYVGCSEACAAELVDAPALEALRIDPETGIAFDSDLLNPEA
jgi:hypothetical protein